MIGLVVGLLGSFAPTSVQARVEPQQVMLGEPFVYELVLTHEKAKRFELQTPGDLGAFELLGETRSRIDGADSSTTTFKVRLSLFELGKKPVPTLTFDVFDDVAQGKWIAPSEVEVEVVSSLPADAQEKGEDLYGIKGNEQVPVRTYRWVWALVGVLAAAALGYAAYRWWKRPRPVQAPAPKAREPLHVRTFAALDKLREEDLPGKGRQREFYFQLSDIVRGYLGERYGFDALECTSGELLDALRKLHTPGLPHEELARFSAESDFVKFAKFPASPDQCKSALELGYRLVSLTLPQLPSAPPTAHAPRA